MAPQARLARAERPGTELAGRGARLRRRLNTLVALWLPNVLTLLFDAEEDQTRVTLQHRGFEVHGEAGPGMRESVGPTAPGRRCSRDTAPQPDPRSLQSRVPGDRNPAWSWEWT
jgi:hypothetical protein